MAEKYLNYTADEINALLDKVNNGEVLTVEEKTKLQNIDLTQYTTETKVQELIANAQLGNGDGDSVDLSGYVTDDELTTELNKKQDKLVSGTNIKTINGTSILGSGDITIEGGSSDSVDLSDYATKEELGTKQDTLVSGTNIKTINGKTLLGGGDVTINAEVSTAEIESAVSKTITENPSLVSTVQAGEITIDKLSNATGVINMVKQLKPVEQVLRNGKLSTNVTGKTTVIPVNPNDEVHFIVNSYDSGFDYSEYTYYAFWDASKTYVSKTYLYSSFIVGKTQIVTVPDNCYYVAFPIEYDVNKADIEVYINPTGNVLTAEEQIDSLYGMKLTSSLEFDNFMKERVKKINPNFNYKGKITGDELPYLVDAEKYDCYLYVGASTHNYEVYDDIIEKGDLVYSLGANARWKKAKLPHDVDLMNIHETHADICIVGGGAGGIACAYALKDSGYNVVLVEQLDSLGGTHINAGVIQLLPSPVPSFFKPICEEALANEYLSWYKSDYSVGSETETNFDKLWRGSFINYDKAGASWGNSFNVNPIYFAQRYYEDLSPTIDIRLNRKFVDAHEIDGEIQSIECLNKVTGGMETIYAHYFVDCSADGVLARSGKTIDVDYFIGADPKTLYNETAIQDGFEGNHYEINSLEPTYMTRTYGNRDTDVYPLPDFKPCGVDVYGLNNKWNAPQPSKKRTWKKVEGFADKYCNSNIIIYSPDMHAKLTSADYIDNGYEWTYNKGVNNAKAHWKVMRNGTPNYEMYMNICKMLAIRETYRINCEKMLVQSDVETLATSTNAVEKHYIALSSWYVDMHDNVSVNKDTITFKKVFGIPYECTIPKAHKNVLVACRGAGFSHIAASACRLTKTMMFLGWSVGKAVQQARANWLTDMRNVDITQLQADCEVLDILADLEANFTLE